MKKVFLILFIFNQMAFSQNFKPGISIGIVASQVDGDRLDGYDKPGFKAGILVKNQLKSNYSFYLGLDYIQKGSRKLANPDIPDDRFYILRLNYIEVPFIFQYTYKSKYIGELGFVFGYLFKANEDVDGNGFMEPYPPFKSYDIPFRCGLGYKIGKRISLKLHYSYSILPIRNHPGNQTWYFDRGQYNNYLILSIFYLYE
jgi:hypothetical protein